MKCENFELYTKCIQIRNAMTLEVHFLDKKILLIFIR